MFIRLVVSLLCLLFISPVCLAENDTKRIYDALGVPRPSVAVIGALPPNMLSNEIRDTIRNKMQIKYAADKYDLKPSDEVSKKIRDYAERHRIFNATQLTKDDLISFGKENKYDYVIFLAFQPASSNIGSSVMSVSVAQNIQLRGRIVDVANEKVIHDTDVIERGTSKSVPILFGGAPSWEKAAKEAIEKSLDEFNAQTSIPLIVPTGE